MERYSARICLAVILLVVWTGLGLHTAADAACNAIPSAKMVYSEAGGVLDSIDPGLSYRGPGGYIDRPFVVGWERGGSAKMPVIFVGPNLDPDCPTRPLVGPNGSLRLTEQDLVVSLVLRPLGGAPYLLVFAPSAGGCDAVRRRRDEYEGEFARLRCLPSDARVAVRVDERMQRVGIAIPDHGELAELFGLSSPFAGRMTVAVTTVEAGVPRGLGAGTCASIVGTGFNGVACLDELFADVDGRCGISRKDRDPGMRFLTMIPGDNDFAKLCRTESGKYPLLLPCLASLDELVMEVDDDGPARASFSWNLILSPDIGGGLRRRELAGSTAIPRVGDQSADEIRIPGREFLASTDLWGGGKPHKPRFETDILVDSTRPNELNLAGDADKRSSVLHFYPRRVATRVCEGTGEACDGVKNEKPQSCVCDGRIDPCKCDKLAKAQIRHFACVGGDHDGMPCTRPGHCYFTDPSGGLDKTPTCTGVPTCHEIAGAGIAGVCNRDADCALGFECGKPLFDLRSRRDANRRVTIQRVVAQGAGKRGVCDDPGQAGDGDVCDGDPSDCGTNVECVRFRMDARDKAD